MAKAQGAIDPEPGCVWADAPSAVRGWAFLGSGRMVRVDLLVDGVSHGLARIGLGRPDISAWAAQPEAAVCGFEHVLAPGDLPPGAGQVSIGALAHGANGETFAVPERRFAVERSRPDPPEADRLSRDLAHLRLRVRQAAARAPAAPTHPVKLLAFTHELALHGGAPLYLVELLRRLRAGLAGFECLVATFEDGPMRNVLEAMRIPVHVSCEASHDNPVAYEGRLAELAAWAAPQGFNTVLASSTGAFAGVDLASRLGVPAVWAIHEGSEPAEWWSRLHGAPPHPYMWERLRGAFDSAAAVVFGTEATREQFLRHGSPDRFVTVPYGIRLDDIDTYRAGFDRERARQDLGIAGADTVLLCLATIEPRKGQTALAMAFAALAEAHPDAVLVLVGDTGQYWTAPYVAQLRRYVSGAGLDSRVVIAPVTSDPYRWLGIADLLVLASDIESLPLVVLEGMAFELGVVATAVSGLPELIDDGRTGWLCRPRDVADLTAALGRALAASPAQRQAVARAGAARMRERHDSRRYAAALGHLLGALAADPEAAPAGPLAQADDVAPDLAPPAAPGATSPGRQPRPASEQRDRAGVPLVEAGREPLLAPLDLWEEDLTWEEFLRWPQEYLAYLTLLCDLKATDAVLEIGCRAARTMLGLWDYLRPPGRYEGFDVSPAHIDYATRHLHRARPHFRFTHADVHHPWYNPAGALDAAEFAFPYPAESFDVIYASSVFTHLLTPATANYFEQSRRVLRPTGRCLFSFMLADYYEQARDQGVTPEWEVRHRLEGVEGVAVEDVTNPTDVVAYDRAVIERLADRAGLRVERVLPGAWSRVHPGWVHDLDLILLAPA